jgi:hypothetical protein
VKGFGRAALIAVFSFEAFLSDRRHGASLTERYDLIIKKLRQEKFMNTMRNFIIPAIGFALLVSPSAASAGFAPSAALQSACRGDAFRLCSGSLTSMDSVIACLRQKKSQASPGCQAQYDAEAKAAAQK